MQFADARLEGALLAPGTSFGSYRVIRCMGEGGMSRVWLAVDMHSGLPCALKEARRFSSPGEDGAAMRSLLDEAELLSGLDHPSVPKVYDLIVGDGMAVMAMEFVEGVALSITLAGRSVPFDAAMVVRWGCQLCAALQYLHARTPAVIFRDLKPANVVLSSNGCVRLVDFGIACRQGSGAASRLLGTRGYAAPEQLDGTSEVGPEADIYALGVTLHRLLTLRTPDADGTPPPLLRVCRSNLPASLEAVVARCTNVDPESRYESCAEVARDLARSARVLEVA